MVAGSISAGVRAEFWCCKLVLSDILHVVGRELASLTFFKFFKVWLVWALFCTVFFFARVIPTLASADLSLLLICSEPFLSRSVGVNYYVSCAKLYKVSAVLRHSSPSDVCVPWHLYVYVCMCVCCVRRTLPIWQTCWDGMCGYMACVVIWMSTLSLFQGMSRRVNAWQQLFWKEEDFLTSVWPGRDFCYNI